MIGILPNQILRMYMEERVIGFPQGLYLDGKIETGFMDTLSILNLSNCFLRGI
jgi:hypothetical protein